MSFQERPCFQVPSAAELKALYREKLDKERAVFKEAVKIRFLNECRVPERQICVCDDIQYDWQRDAVKEIFEPLGYTLDFTDEFIGGLGTFEYAYVNVCDSKFYLAVGEALEEEVHKRRLDIEPKKIILKRHFEWIEKQKQDYTREVLCKFHAGIETFQTEISVAPWPIQEWQKILVRKLFQEYKIDERSGHMYVIIEP